MASTMFDTIMARMDAGTLDDQTPAPAARVAPTGSDVLQGATAGLGLTVQGVGALGEALSGGTVGSGLREAGAGVSERAAAAAPGAQPGAGYADETQFNVAQSLGSSVPLSATGALSGAVIGRGIGTAIGAVGGPVGAFVGGTVGGVLTAAAASFLSELGQMRQEQVATGKGGQASDLLPYAAASAALELGNDALDTGVGAVAAAASRRLPVAGPVIGPVVNALAGKQGSTRRALTAGVAAGAATSAITEPPIEAAQEYSQVLARRTYDPEYTTDRPEVQQRVSDAAWQALKMAPWMGGGLGLLGGVGHVAQKREADRVDLATRLAEATGITPQLDRAPTVADLTPVYEQYAAANGVDISGIKSSGSARLLDIYGTVTDSIRANEQSDVAARQTAEQARSQLEANANAVGVPTQNRTSTDILKDILTTTERRRAEDESAAVAVNPVVLKGEVSRVLGIQYADDTSRGVLFGGTAEEIKKVISHLTSVATKLGVDPKQVEGAGVDKAQGLYTAVVDRIANNVRQTALNTRLGLGEVDTAARAQRRQEATDAIKKIGNIPVRSITAETVTKALKQISKIDPLHPANFATDSRAVMPDTTVMFVNSTAATTYHVDAIDGQGNAKLTSYATGDSFVVPSDQVQKVLAPINLAKWNAAVNDVSTSVADRTRLIVASTDPDAIAEKVREYNAAPTAPTAPASSRSKEQLRPLPGLDKVLAVERVGAQQTKTGKAYLNFFRWGERGDSLLTEAKYSKLLNAVKQGDAKTILEELEATYPHSNINRAIVARLRQLNDVRGSVSLSVQIKPPPKSTWAGAYDPMSHTILLHPSKGLSRGTLLHELVHAYTAIQIENIKRGKSPKTEAYVQLNRAYNDVKKYLAERGITAYAMDSLHEFVAEAMSDAGFQTILHEFEAVGKKSAWTKFVDVVAKLLGLRNTDGLARVMSLVDEVAFSQIEGGKSLSYLAKDFTGLQMYAQSTIEPTEEENAARIRSVTKVPTTATRFSSALTRLENLALTIAPMDKFVRHTSRYFSGMPINPMTVINRLRQERTNFEDTLATEATRNVHLWDKLFSADQKNQINLVADRMASTLLDPRLPLSAQEFTQDEWTRRGLDQKFGSYAESYAQTKGAYEALNKPQKDAIGTMFGAVKSLTNRYLDALTTRYMESLDPEKFSHEERVKAATEFRNNFKLLPGAYMPNMRIGKYLLSVGNIVTQPDGSRKFVRQYIEGLESHAAAVQRVKDLEAAGKHAFFEEKQAFHERVEGVGAEVVNRMEGALRASFARRSGVDHNSEEAAAFEQAVNYTVSVLREAAIDALPESSFFKNQQRREFIAGQSQDRIRDYLLFTMKMSHRIGDAEFGLKQYNELAKMRDHIRQAKQGVSSSSRVIPEMSTVYNAMAERVRGSMKSGTNGLTDMLSRISFAMYLSSPSQFFVQATQPYTYWAAKMIGSGHDAADVYGKLNKWMFKNLTNKRLRQQSLEDELYTPEIETALDTFRTVTLDDVLEGQISKPVGDYVLSKEQINAAMSAMSPETQQKIALRLALDRGLIDISLVHEGRRRASEATVDTEAGTAIPLITRAWHGFEKVLALPMQKSETWVRMSTMLSGFELAREKGVSFLDAVLWSENMTRETQFDYTSPNRAPVLNNPTARLLSNMQTFRINTIASSLMDMHDAFSKASTPEEKKAARTALMWMYASTASLGGVAAVPFAGLALWITSLLISSVDDDPQDVDLKEELDKALLSGPFGTVFARGIPAALGADISKRITLSDLVTIPFADMPDYIEGRAASDRLAATILGPTFDASVRMGLEARKAIRDGDWVKFLTVFMPKMLADGVKATDIATNGVRTADGTMLIQDPSPWDIISAALGIRSTEVSLQRDLNAYQVVGDHELAYTKGRIMDKYVRAVQENGDIAGALADMMQWNELHPDAAIEGTAIRAAIRAAFRQQTAPAQTVDERLAALAERR